MSQEQLRHPPSLAASILPEGASRSMEHVLAEADREQLIREPQDISHTTKQRERLSRLLRRSSLRAMEEWASVQPPRTIFLIFTVPQKPRSHSLGLTQDSGRSDTTSATDPSQSPHQRLSARLIGSSSPEVETSALGRHHHMQNYQLSAQSSQNTSTPHRQRPPRRFRAML